MKERKQMGGMKPRGSDCRVNIQSAQGRISSSTLLASLSYRSSSPFLPTVHCTRWLHLVLIGGVRSSRQGLSPYSVLVQHSVLILFTATGVHEINTNNHPAENGTGERQGGQGSIFYWTNSC